MTFDRPPGHFCIVSFVVASGRIRAVEGGNGLSRRVSGFAADYSYCGRYPAQRFHKEGRVLPDKITYSLEDWCLILNKGKQSVRRALAAGALPPPLAIPGRQRWSRKAVQDWLRSNGLAADKPAGSAVEGEHAETV